MVKLELVDIFVLMAVGGARFEIDDVLALLGVVSLISVFLS